MAENQNKAQEIYNQNRSSISNTEKLQQEQVSLLKGLLEAQKRKDARDKEFTILGDIKKEIINSYESSDTLKETIRNTLVDGIKSIDNNISSFVKTQVMTGGRDIRNRFSNTKLGKLNERYDKKIDFLEQTSTSFVKKVFTTMIVGGFVTSIVSGLAATMAFKKFFSSVSEETKTTARMFKALTTPFVENMKFMKEFRSQKGMLSMLGSNIKKSGLVGGLLGGALDIKRAKIDNPLANFKSQVFGDTFDKLKGFGIKKDFATDAYQGAKGVLQSDLSGAATDDLAKISKRATGLKNVIRNASPEGVKGIYSALMGEASEIGKLAKSLKLNETVHVLKKAGLVGLGKGSTGVISKIFAGTIGAAGKAGVFVAKGLGKAALKRLPMIGGIFSIMSGFDRWGKGEKAQGLIDFASGAANFIPGIGWPVSLALDMLNMGIDFAKMDPGKGTAAIGAGAKVFKYTKFGLKALKKIPGLGLIISTGLGMKKWNDGDKTGALLEFASGLASTIPGLGTIVSIGIDLISTARDFKQFESGSMLDTGFQAVKKFGKEQMRNLPVIGTFIRLKEAMALWNKGDKAGAMKEGAIALSTMIPGVGVVYSLMDYFGGDKEANSIAAAGKAGMAAPKTQGTGAGGKLSRKQASGLAKGYRENLQRAQKSGDKAGVAFWQSKQDALMSQVSNVGTKHTSVGVSNADMDNVQWDAMGGRSNVEKAILGVWNSAGIEGQPTFTSGFRDGEKNKKLKLSNPNSKHLTGMAFDLRGKDIPIDKRGEVEAGLIKAFGNSGYSVYPHGEGDLFHYHLQYPAPGAKEAAATAKLEANDPYYAAKGAVLNRPIIAGEAGPEAIIPLNGQGIGVIAEAMNRAINVNGARSAAPSKTSEEFKSFLVETFAPALANQIAKVNKAKNIQQSKTPSVEVL
jgi:hypothetical protein